MGIISTGGIMVIDAVGHFNKQFFETTDAENLELLHLAREDSSKFIENDIILKN